MTETGSKLPVLQTDLLGIPRIKVLMSSVDRKDSGFYPYGGDQSRLVPPTKENVIDIYGGGGIVALGDLLLYTPLINATPVRLILKDTKENRQLAPLLDGLCEVCFLSELPLITEDVLPYVGTHLSHRLLMTYGLDKYPCLPRIKLTIKELQLGWNIVSKYRSPVVIRDVTRTGGVNSWRNAPMGFFQRIVDLNPDHTFLSFGLTLKHLIGSNENISKLRNVVMLDDLPIRIVAACYYWIGRYVGVDTGNYHLMLAVGGKCDVFEPPPENRYNYKAENSFYPVNAWSEGGEPVINYIYMDNPSPPSIIGLKYSFVGMKYRNDPQKLVKA